MADEPITGSVHIAAVRPDANADGRWVPIRIVASDEYGDGVPRILVELPDRPLRDLGKVDALIENTVSTVNSSTTTLGSGAEFQGTFEDVSQMAAVVVTVTASHSSATDGVEFIFSTDGSNDDDVNQFTLDTSKSSTRRFQFPVTAQYFRVNYTNGGTQQDTFKIQTIYHRTSPSYTSIHRLDDDIDVDRSVTVTKSAIAGKVNSQISYTAVTDGNYDNVSLTNWREVRTRDQRALDLADCNDYTVFTVLGDDTTNLADSTDHLFGTGAITFDKANGTANTMFAGVQDSFTAIDISELYENGGFVALGCKIPSLTDVAYAFLRVGTDSSNYNEWQWDDSELTAGSWLALRSPTNQPTTYQGNGWNTASISYVAFGVAFDSETDTLSGMIFDNVHMVGGRVTDSTIDASVTSSVNTPNINLHRVGGTPVDTNTGNATTATQRVVLASDQPTVTVDNASVDGPGSPTIDSYAHIALDLTTGTNTVLVSSAANKQIWVYGVEFTCGDADGQTVSFQDEDDTAITGIMEFAQYGGMSISPSGNFSMPIWKLATDKDLEVDVTGGAVDGSLWYAIVSVS